MSVESPKTPLGMVAAAFGLFAGLASLVVILGGAVLSWRLRSQGLPPEAVVAALPREFLISVGLGVTIQLVVFLLALLPGFLWERVDVAMAAAWVGASALAYPFLRVATGWEWLFLAVAWVATAFLLLGFLRWGRRRWGSTRETVPVVALVMVGLAFFIPWRAVFEWRSAQGLDALVCLVGQEGLSEPFVGKVNGLFIGENDNSVYIGEKNQRGNADPPIAQIPREFIGLIFVGEDVDEQDCLPD